MPAFNLAIDTVASSNVTPVTVGTTTTFTATGSGATLDVAAILAQLVAGNDVVVDTGATGLETGNITWNAAADLDFNSISGSRSLTLQTNNAMASAGGISVAADLFDSNPVPDDILALVLNSSATDGNILVTGALADLAGVTLNANTGNVQTGSVASPDGALAFTGGLITLTDDLSTIEADITLTGNVLLTTDVTVEVGDSDAIADNSVTITGTLNGTSADDLNIVVFGTVTLGGIVGAGGQIGDLTINANTTNLSKNLTVGTLGIGRDVNINANMAITTSIGNVDFSNGTVTLNANLTVTLPGAGNVVQFQNGGTLDVNSKVLIVSTGALALSPGGTLSGTGTVIADVQVDDGGAISPGGAGVGTLAITGDVDFQGMMGGSFIVTISGATSDLLDVTGTVTIAPFTTQLQVTGSLSNGAVVTLIDATSLTGTFQGNGTFILGNEAVTTNYTATTLTIVPAPAQPGKTFTGLTPGGDLFKIRLLGTGPGQLVIVGGSQIVVRNARASNTLQITVTPNGGPGTVDLSQIIVQTGIGAITGATANVGGGVRVNGALGLLTLRDLQGTSTLGGTNTNKTKIVTRFLENGSLTSSGRIASLTALGIDGMDISATTIGTLTVKANPTLGTPGDISNFSTVTVSGFFGTTKLGLGAVNVAGSVIDSTFNVLAGNVGSFITKKFIGSKLYAGYTPSGIFTDTGTFLGNFKINTFRTTATVFPDAINPNPQTRSFADSEVVAARLGVVRLSSVDTANGLDPFGLKVRTGIAGNVGSVRVAAPTPAFDPLANLQPGFVSGDFRFLQQI